MKIDGREIAEGVRSDLKSRIQDLKTKNITPKIAIITLGDESSWATYVRQKIKVASELGIIAELVNLRDADESELLRTVSQIDNDKTYHGIIVQRPMPSSFSREKVINAISTEKDIDGFRPDSEFEVPVWLAVKKIIESRIMNHESWSKLGFVVLGKGETAGSPAISGLKKLGIEPQVIDSKTENPDEILKRADVIISCVGRSGIIKPSNIKPGAILIGVGIRGEDGKVRGDYLEEDIENVASAYTPTPGGVGPVNLSYLFANLIDAAEQQNHIL